MSVSKLKLHQLRLNRLSDEEAREVLEELERTDSMHLLDDLVEEDETFLERYPSSVAAQHIRAKLRRSEPEPVRKRSTARVLIAAVVGVCLVVAVAFSWFATSGNQTATKLEPAVSKSPEITPKEKKSLVPEPVSEQRLIFIERETRPLPLIESVKRFNVGSAKMMKIVSKDGQVFGEAQETGYTTITAILGDEKGIFDYLVTVGHPFDGTLTNVVPEETKQRMKECKKFDVPDSVRMSFDSSGMVLDVEITIEDDAHRCLRRALRGSTVEVSEDGFKIFAADLRLDFL